MPFAFTLYSGELSAAVCALAAKMEKKVRNIMHEFRIVQECSSASPPELKTIQEVDQIYLPAQLGPTPPSA